MGEPFCKTQSNPVVAPWSNRFWLAQQCRPLPPSPRTSWLSVAMLRFHMAFLLIVGLVGEGVKVADDTATQTPEEWHLVFERDWLGQLPGIGQLQERHFKNWAQFSKKQGNFFCFYQFHLELQNGRPFPLAATKWWDTEIVRPCSLWMGTIHFVDWYGLAGQSLQWVTQCSFTKVVQTRTTQRDASGLDVLVVLPGAEAVPRARP